ncbi:hypothetical protein ACIBO2_24390 [Nonomuraea sp. NPDC050022]|uniref:hypothetical protein n=1 Tax=Nonomuraea sp. NPDC050022 TaxID=3364358 RepID=UPI0037969845
MLDGLQQTLGLTDQAGEDFTGHAATLTQVLNALANSAYRCRTVVSSATFNALADYWARRRRRHTPPLSERIVRLLRKPDARCPLCGDHLLVADHEPAHPHEWEQWHRTVRKAITKHTLETADTGRAGPPDKDRIHLINTHCRRQLPPAGGSQQALLPTTPPSRLA